MASYCWMILHCLLSLFFSTHFGNHILAMAFSHCCSVLHCSILSLYILTLLFWACAFSHQIALHILTENSQHTFSHCLSNHSNIRIYFLSKNFYFSFGIALPCMDVPRTVLTFCGTVEIIGDSDAWQIIIEFTDPWLRDISTPIPFFVDMRKGTTTVNSR